MESKKLNREWVKTAAIILLSVLLVLTFFSNTILNISLPEVATAFVTDGTITAKVKGTGTVSAIGNTQIKATSTTTVASVKAKEGAEVAAGDILFIMGESSEELQAAQNELDSLNYQLMRAQNSYPVNTSTDSVNIAYNKWAEALAKAADAEVKYNTEFEKQKNNADLIAATTQKTADENAIKIEKEEYNAEKANQESAIESARNVYDNAYSAYLEAQKKSDPDIDKIEKSLNEAKYALDNSKSKLEELENTHTTKLNNLETDLAKQNAIISSFDISGYYSEWQRLNTLASEAESNYWSAYEKASSQNASNAQSATSTYIDILELQNKIEKQKQKVASLSGGEDNAITAPVAGTITSISASPGASVAKGDVLCVIEVPDMGYQLSFSVTNDQAKRIKVGDTATVSNYYWGSEIVATVSSIKVDPKNSQTNKLITFTLDGDVANGSQLTIAVGEKSQSYDVIVPNSAIRNDSNGTFVLAVDSSRSNALGNRYFAKRVQVEVLASDDNSSAVSGGIANGDFVITTSSAPIKNGDQVRLADNSNG